MPGTGGMASPGTINVVTNACMATCFRMSSAGHGTVGKQDTLSRLEQAVQVFAATASLTLILCIVIER